MNLYFTASIVAKPKYLKKYLAIRESVISQGVTLQADHILNTSEEEIHFASRGEREDFHHKLEHWIATCDGMVVEASYPSISVGYEISMALHFHKPILILYSEGFAPSLLHQFKEELVICQAYKLPELPEIMRAFIDYVKEQPSSRFTLTLPADLAHFLDWQASEHHISKADYLRALLEKTRDEIHHK